MNSGRFSDKELQELHEEVRFYIPKFVKLQEDVQAHLLEEKEWKVLLKSMRVDVGCLHKSMEEYKPSLDALIKIIPALTKLADSSPQLDTLLTRYAQGKGIFWFLMTIMVGLASIYDWMVIHARKFLVWIS